MQNAQDTVGVADAGYFRIGGNDGFVGKVECHQCTLFDTGRGVADNELEAHFFAGQLFHHVVHAFAGQRVFVAGLRGGQDVEVFAVFVFNQGLVECGFALDDVDEVIHDAAFATHNQVEVAQTDVEVDYGGFVAAQGQAGCDAGAGSGLAYAAFT